MASHMIETLWENFIKRSSLFKSGTGYISKTWISKFQSYNTSYKISIMDQSCLLLALKNVLAWKSCFLSRKVY